MRYTMYYLMPMTLLFGIPLFAALICQAYMFASGKTPYPKRAAFYNMAVGAIVVFAAAAVIGNNLVGDALSISTISLGHIFMFGMLLAEMLKEMDF